MDHLWLQRQQAKRLLPLGKAKGDLNPADLTTKHLSESDIKKYIAMLDQDFRGGRADEAAKLHSLRPRAVKLTGDSWDCTGAKRIWRRHRRTWRRCLFTPLKVPGGPREGKEPARRRVADGITKGGHNFRIVDDWESRSCSHRMLET